MLRYLIKYLSWISIIALLVQGCSLSRQFRNPGEPGNIVVIDNVRPPFPNDFQKFLYKTSIAIYGQKLDGMIMIKKTGLNSFKVAFFNELGMGFFEGDLQAAGNASKLALHMNSGNPIFNRKEVVKNLESDFNMLLANEQSIKAGNLLEEKGTGKLAIQVPGIRGSDFYFIEPSSGNILRILNAGKRAGKSKIEIDLEKSHESQDIPEVIRIQHNKISLEINMKRIMDI